MEVTKLNQHVRGSHIAACDKRKVVSTNDSYISGCEICEVQVTFSGNFRGFCLAQMEIDMDGLLPALLLYSSSLQLIASEVSLKLTVVGI